MIRSNSFAMLIGAGAEEELRRKVGKVARCSGGVRIGPAESFGVSPEDGREIAIAVFPVADGSTLPIVHGFFDGARGRRIGEFSLLDRTDDGFIAERDAIGTRQLYAASGKSVGVASDFRFFDSPPGDLLPPGATYSFKSGKTRRRKLVPEKREMTLKAASLLLADQIDESVGRCLGGSRKVAVAFSGGLDSSVVACSAKKHAAVTLFSVFAKGSKDETWSGKAADMLDIEHVGCPVAQDDVDMEVRNLHLPFSPTPMDKALWCIYSAAGRAARERKLDLMLLGQLADELFGGYMKYSLELQRSGEGAAKRMMEEDVEGCSSRGFIRDETACSRWVEPRFPLADEGVVRLALGLPVEYKISGKERKVVLRRAAIELGLPEALTELPKKAAQYSSGVMRLVR